MPQQTANFAKFLQVLSRPDAQNAVRRYHGGDLNGKRLEATAKAVWRH